MSQRNERSTEPSFPSVPHWVIHQAARRAPEALASRLEEEWLADLESRSTTLSRLRFAMGCCRATLVIVHDCAPSRAAAASAVAHAGGTVTLVDRTFGYFSLRSATLFLIAGLHAALFYGLVTSLAHTHQAAVPPNLQNHLVSPVPPEKTPVVFARELDGWTFHVPRRDLVAPTKVDIESDPVGEVVDKPTQVISQPVSPEPPVQVVRLTGGPGAGFPDTADFYPSPSIRLGEQGLTTIQVCVDKQGRLTSDPTTVKGSGMARLDDAALKLARAGSGHYRATMENGQPVNSCYPFGVRFQLKK